MTTQKSVAIEDVVAAMRRLRRIGTTQEQAIQMVGDMFAITCGEAPSGAMLRAATEVVYGAAPRCADCPALLFRNRVAAELEQIDRKEN